MPAPVSANLRKYLAPAILTNQEIKLAVTKLARLVEDHYLPGEFGLVPLLPQSCVFYVDFLRELRIPVRVFPAPVSVHIKKQVSDSEFDYEVKTLVHRSDELPKNVLVLHTLVDCGLDLLDFVADVCAKVTQVKQVRTCTLFTTKDAQSKAMPIDFVGREINCDTLNFVGYGLNYKGYFPQLDYLTYLKEEF